LAVLAVRCLEAAAPVADAAERADWTQLRRLLEQPADARAAQPDGTTALHWAAHHASADAVRRLLAAGADPNAVTRYGVTPLSLACVSGNDEVIVELLSAGANPNAALHGGETPLMTASRTGRPGPVRRLLAAGADPNAKTRGGQTAVMWAAAEGHADVLGLLIASGADITARVKSGFTPLLFAARDGRSQAVQTLLKAGADPNDAIEVVKPADGKAPIHGTSALMLAVENGHFDLAINLVQAGADPNDSRTGYTPLHALSWVRKPNRGDGDDGLPPPESSGSLTSLQFVRELVRLGADPNARLKKAIPGHGVIGRPGATPFLFAAKTDDLAYLQVLVEVGADPTLTTTEGTTALMAAAGLGAGPRQDEAGTEPEALEAIEYLLQLGADVNAVNRSGETAMHGAAYKGMPQVVRLLAERGAKIEVWNRKNTSGWTPIMIAEGFRPGNFTPSFETVEAFHQVLRAAGLPPPPPTPRPTASKIGYDPQQ
jgi:ankyrin repeat protein